MSDKKEIVNIIAEQMRNRIPILDDLREDSVRGGFGLGIEGWFRIEIYCVLRRRGINVTIKNVGPDLIFDNFELELKASQLGPSQWIREQGLKYPGVDCMFLGPVELINTIEPYYYSDIDGHWIVGIIREEVKDE